MKALALLLFVVIAPACAEYAMDDCEDEPTVTVRGMAAKDPPCDVMPLRSTYVVSCGKDADGVDSGFCRGAQGEIMYSNCYLPNGLADLHCVLTCD